jgi:flagellar basal body-associated protein FliL
MENGKKGVRPVVVIIIALLCLCLGAAGSWYLGKEMSKKEAESDKTEEKVAPVENKDEKTMVEKNLKEVVDALNGKNCDEVLAATVDYVVDDDALNDNLWDYQNGIAGMLMACVYNEKYIDSPEIHGGQLIMSKEQYNNLKKHFEITKEYSKYHYYFDEGVYAEDEAFANAREALKEYDNGEYYIAYVYGDGYGLNNYNIFKYDEVTGSNGKYRANIVFTTQYAGEGDNTIKEYTGTLELTIVDGITHFGALKLTKSN